MSDPRVPDGSHHTGSQDDNSPFAAQVSGAAALAVEGTIADQIPGGAEPYEDRRASLAADAWRELKGNKVFWVAGTLITVLLIMALFPSLFTNQDPQFQQLTQSKAPPSSAHIFGQDELGRDVYARCVYGARVSIFVGLLVTLGSTLVGVLLGSLAGFYGGALDAILSRVTDIFFAIPLTLAAIVILTVVRSRNIFTITLVLVALGWTGLVRIMRSAVISTKNTDYVQAARALGASNRRIIIRHVLPNAIAPVIVVATINIGAVIVSEATLSFLGVGLQPPSISWGLMISSAQQLVLDYPHLLLFPAMFLSATVLSFVLLGDAVRDALDPKLR